MIIVLFIEEFTDAMAQFWVSSNLHHDRSLKGSVVDVELHGDEVSWLAYATNDIKRMRSLPEVICYWGIVKVQPAQLRVLCLSQWS